MKSFSQAITVFILFYIIFVSIMYVLQRKLLYYPWKAQPSLKNLGGIYSEVQTQTEDQLTLTHWYARRGLPYIVVLHGNAGNIEGRGYKFNFLVDQGYSVLLVSYRGYGGNPGQPTEKDLISDSSLALEWLFRKEGISSKEVVLLGESLGSGVAVALAVKYPVRGLIFDGAYSSISDVGQSVYPLLPVRWLLKDTWNSKDRIQKVRSPTLFIHSRKDKLVPFRFALRLFEAAHEPKKYIWLEQIDHNGNLQTKAVRDSIVEFIQSLF